MPEPENGLSPVKQPMTTSAKNKVRIPEETRLGQLAVSDPGVSSWVSANAGAGKTHVLTQRVIRLMLDGNSPDRILCLTFTKAAAAEMKNRVFETLSRWTMMDGNLLDEAILETSGQKATAKKREIARQLFARALDTPGGLRIQTIHAHCEALLHQFPLEANVPGHFTTLQESEQTQLLQFARQHILAKSPDAMAVYSKLVDYASDSAIEDGLSGIIGMRREFLEWAGLDPTEALRSVYEFVGLNPEDTQTSLKEEILRNFPVSSARVRAIVSATVVGTDSTDKPVGRAFSALTDGTDIDTALEMMQGALLTKDNTIRKTLATKAIIEHLPDVINWLTSCAEHIIQGLEKVRAHRLLENSGFLFQMAYQVIERYEALKRSRGVVDFDDLINKTASLLNRRDIGEWIRYRLDRGIDHILVDEAQDTSPAQWQVINAITADFHTGMSASSRVRTVFVVGDEKQSIYSFQGARLDEYDKQQRALRSRVTNSQNAYHSGCLHLSFRSTPDVLRAVDKVFSAENATGLTQEGSPPVHDSIRRGDPGEVQIWPLIEPMEESEPKNWFDPIDKPQTSDPAIILAQNISGEIGQLVGTPLPGTGKPVRYQDIMVLVRSRDRFTNALVRTLKDAGHSIAGADRLKLTAHIAIEDLMAAAKFALMPNDDLVLAALLKSPFFGFDEQQLFDLATNRKSESLFDYLCSANHPTTEPTISLLMKLVEASKELGVYEFFAMLLGEQGGRTAILSRLGAEAEDILDAFLDESLESGSGLIDNLEHFVARLEHKNIEIKRETDMARDEIKIMTVHSAKGLEAPVVFLVDSNKDVWTEKYLPKVLPLHDCIQNPGYLWLPEKKFHNSITKQCSETLQLDAEAEYRRLLYVGMTRAADRLIVCGYKGSREVKPDSWHSLVSNMLSNDAEIVSNADGTIKYWRWIHEKQTPHSYSDTGESKPVRKKLELPDWLYGKVIPEPALPKPLTPSDAHALIQDGIIQAKEVPLRPSTNDSAASLEWGNLTHRLLQVLPNHKSQERRTLAEGFLKNTSRHLDRPILSQLANQVMNILEGSEFKHLFGEKSRAEVSVAGRINIGTETRYVSGQIDRLVVTDNQIMILDYKTDRYVSKNVENTPIEYLLQLALYCKLIRQVYPGKPVTAALLWTRIPKLQLVPETLLDSSFSLIKQA